MVFSSPIYMKLLSQSSFKTVIILFIHMYCAYNFVFLIVDYTYIENTGHTFELFLYKKRLFIRIHGVKNGIKMLKKHNACYNEVIFKSIWLS